MKLQVRNLLLAVSALALCYPLTLSAQFVSSTTWLTIRDDLNQHDSLTYGTHALATYCIDTALGEFESPPPPPPPAFFASFQSITGTGRVNCFTVGGLYEKDLRDFSTVAKKDTFWIDFTNNDTAANHPEVSVMLRWPDSTYLSLRCDSMFLSDRVGGGVFPGRINMLAQDSLLITGCYDGNGTNLTA